MITTRLEFIEALEKLKKSLDEEPDKWENRNLEDFFEAMIAYTKALPQLYKNTKQNHDADEASWKVFSDILSGAKIYE